MSYFVPFPYMFYGFSDDKSLKLVKDITARVKLIPQLQNNDVLYSNAIIKDGELPEHLAYKYYGNAQYHWIVLLVNQIITPDDWPISDNDVETMTLAKYGTLTGTHHREDSDGNIVPSGGVPITYLEYERNQNDDKRVILMLKPEVVSFFVEEYERLISESIGVE